MIEPQHCVFFSIESPHPPDVELECDVRFFHICIIMDLIQETHDSKLPSATNCSQLPILKEAHVCKFTNMHHFTNLAS